jgi:hypothetical protein
MAHYGFPLADTLIALRHALKNYLGRNVGLPAVIRAVINGGLVPLGRTNRFPGITGYLFAAQDLRRYRPAPGVKGTPEGFLNYGEAAALLGVQLREIRGLVAAGLLHDAVDYQFGLSKLLSAADVQMFADSFVAISAIAKQSNLNTVALMRYLKESGTPLLSIPLPEKGSRHAHFLRKDIAAQIQIPSRRLLREHAQCRAVADRKKRWVRYRLAKEAATGKSMRRQLQSVARRSCFAQVRSAGVASVAAQGSHVLLPEHSRVSRKRV